MPRLKIKWTFVEIRLFFRIKVRVFAHSKLFGETGVESNFIQNLRDWKIFKN